MSKLSHKLYSLLLATSALIAPAAAFGQTPDVLAQGAGDTTAVSQDPITVDEIVSRGAFIPDTMRETTEVSTVLLQEDLARQGDSNVGQALARTSGISLVGGRFVYVRGLGERYSSALLNGSPLPSPEPLQRVVPLDLFPSNVLAGAVVQKTYSASYPGEFGGGVINIETVDAPPSPFFTLGMGFGLNTKTTVREGLTYQGSDTDQFGYDDGTRDMPGLLVQAIRSGRGRISESTFEQADLVRIGSSLVNAPLNLLQSQRDIPGNFKADISAGNTIILGAADVGLIAVAGFDNDWSTRRGIQEEGFLNVAGELSPDTHYDFVSTQNDVTVNALTGVTLNVGESDIRWTNFYVHSSTKEARSRQGYDQLAGRDVRDDFSEWYERELISTQLAGNFEVTSNFTVDWRGAFATTTRDAPYEKSIRYNLDSSGAYVYGVNNSNRTGFGHLKDDIVSAGIDLKYRFALADNREANVAVGYATSQNDRSSSQRLFQFQSSGLPVEIQKQRVDFLFSDYNLANGYFTFREITGADGAAAFDASLDVEGLYAQADAEILPFVRVAAGVRYEEGEQSVRPIDVFGGPAPFSPPPLRNDYLLPTATVTWNFAEDMQLRVGASKTLARPQFRELAPQQYLDPDSDRLFIGNPYLVDSTLTNLDARMEWYFGNNQFLAGGLFYKDIDQPVEAIINEGGATFQTTFINAPKAELYGAEIEMRRYFQAPVGNEWMRNVIWFVSGNYTYTHSELKVSATDTALPLASSGVPVPANIYFNDGDKMQGQSDHLANLQFGFEDDAGLQATLLLSYQSERVSARGRTGFPDLVVDPGVTLDLTVRKVLTMGGHEYSLGFEARNLLDQDFEETQSVGSGVVVVNGYAVGQSVSFSAKRTF